VAVPLEERRAWLWRSTIRSCSMASLLDALVIGTRILL
jgi:hypothetical protein